MLYNILSRIELLIETKKYDKAQNLVNQNLADYPDTPELYALSARIALSQSDDKRAVESINIAIGLNPNIAELFYLKAVALSHLKKHKEALIEINRAIELQPEYSVFYGQKAFILLRQELKEEAIRWARHGKSINANDDVCTNVLSMALGSSGQIEESKEVLGKLLQDDPENEFTHSNMGYNFLREGNIVKAKEHFQSALIINPESIYAKSGMMEAIKGTNFFYRKILQYQSWMEKKSSKNQWVFIIGLLIVIRILPFLIPFYLIFILWIWFAPPVANVVLYLDKHGRYLMQDEMMKYTQVNLGLCIASLASLLILTPIFGLAFLGLSFALFVAIVPINTIYNRERKRNKIAMGVFGLGFVILGLSGVLMSLFGIENTAVWAALLIGIVAFTWLANLFSE